MRKEDMEEQFYKEAKGRWRFAAERGENHRLERGH